MMPTSPNKIARIGTKTSNIDQIPINSRFGPRALRPPTHVRILHYLGGFLATQDISAPLSPLHAWVTRALPRRSKGRLAPCQGREVRDALRAKEPSLWHCRASSQDRD
jgi:hypothetical protein